MWKNFMLGAWRTIRNNKAHSWISIAGLGIAITVCALITLFVSDEWKYDKFNANSSHIYRAVMNLGEEFTNPVTPMPFAQAAFADVPGLEKAVRLFKNRNANALFENGDKKFYESRFLYADSNVFSVFTFQFIGGDPAVALQQPHSVVLNESTALKYFGSTNVVGKAIYMHGENDGYKVTGVVKDFPEQSHFHFNFLLSFNSLSQEHKNNWLIPYIFTYFVIKDAGSVPAIEQKLSAMATKNFAAQVKQFGKMSPADFDKKFGKGVIIKLQPLLKIHLHSNYRVELEPNGNYLYVNIFIIVAILILFLSFVNFINIAVATASVRAKEIGVRKMSGADKKHLLAQFLTEALFACALSVCLAVILLIATMPLFNQLSGKNIQLVSQVTVPGITAFVLMPLVLAVFAGAYPALYLSSLNPSAVFKNAGGIKSGRLLLRRALLVTQFVISIGMIIGVIVINKQVRYMSAANLGFQKEQLVVLPIREDMSPEQKMAVKNSLLQNKNVLSVTMANYVPGKEAYENQDVFIPEGKPKNEFVPVWYIKGDFDMVKTMGFNIIKGRDFNLKFSTDSQAYILNEEAVKKFGWTNDNAVGKTLTTFGNGPDDLITGRVAGVVQDFHFENFSQTIKPMLLAINKDYWSNYIIRIAPNNVQSTITYLNAEWNKFQPKYPFTYSFLDESFAQLWASEEKLNNILLAFTIIAITIACIGLFGLFIFTVNRRVKEIGIRKVLGASVANIFTLLAKEYFFIFVLAFIIAAPLGWLVTHNWIENFVFRASINAWVFAQAAFIIILIALLTISFHAIKAAVANPVRSLRSE